MRKIMIACTLILILTGIGSVYGEGPPDIAKFPQCPYCGMDRAKFAHSRMHLIYDNKSSMGTCSIRCAAVDMVFLLEAAPVEIQVGDYNTKKLIDAQKAFWVIGGKKMGVMTRRAKWAFAKKGDAEKFIKENGGKRIAFEEAIEAAYADMYKDTKMIREKRKKMRMNKMKKN